MTLREGADVAVYLHRKSGDYLVEENTKSREIPGGHTPSALQLVSRGEMSRSGKAQIEQSLCRYELDEPMGTTCSDAEERRFVRTHKCVAVRVASAGQVELTPCHREGLGYVGRYEEGGVTLAWTELSDEEFWVALDEAFERAS